MPENNDHLKNPDGSWKYTNALAKSSSLYLQQHAHNPIDWLPWGKEALERAKAEDKPIFVSIGYSSCYWCHVMEREIFCDEALAVKMNERFINIKVDREEHPDLDEIYMIARQVITKEGGWPNNAFLTPELKPFYAGGTFWAGTKQGTTFFVDVIDNIEKQWRDNRSDVLHMSETLMNHVRQHLNPVAKPQDVDNLEFEPAELVNAAIDGLVGCFDEACGGFYEAPKFPHESFLLFLLDYYEVTKNENTLKMATATLDKMANGGILDHIGGGFHRYAIDRQWNVPHFEKMLYNQALLSKIYCKTFKISDNPGYRFITEQILNFVLEEMYDSDGLFIASIDAESEGKEGKFYLWDEAEIQDALTGKELEIFYEAYTLYAIPEQYLHEEVAGKIVLCQDVTLLQGDKAKLLQKIRNKLNQIRNQRVAPQQDPKIITSWNAMMIDSLAFAGKVLNNKGYIDAASKAMQHLLTHYCNKDSIIRIKGKPRIKGLLEDYALMVRAALSLYSATGKVKWYKEAQKIMGWIEKRFYDKGQSKRQRGVGGGYFYSEQGKDTLMPIKIASDAALLADNAVMLHNVLAMAGLEKTDSKCQDWLDIYNQSVQTFLHEVQHAPLAYVHFIHSFLFADSWQENRQSLGIAANDNSLVATDYVTAELDLGKSPLKIGKASDITLELTIEEGWQLYGPNTIAPLIPLQIDTSASTGLTTDTIGYSDSQTLYNDQGRTISGYKNHVKASITITPTAEKAELVVRITFQLCNDSGVCLMPADMVVRKRLP